MRQIRAKFRCLGINHKWDGNFVIELGAVMNKKSENFEENKTFWKYTPSGEATLFYNKEHDLEVGAYYYIDMVQDEKGDWSLSSITHTGYDGKVSGGQIELSYRRNFDYKDIPKGMLSGSVKMSLSEEAKAALESFGEAGSKWKVTFRFAEPSDD